MEREAEIAQLEQAIAAIEAQQEVLGEAVVRAALAPLREKLTALTTSQGGAAQQLKYVSVLFADIVDSTKIGRHLDPEDIMRVMTGALERFQGVIEAHGGQVTRFMGDGLKAVFGIPLAREDDAERGVRAGLALLEEARRYAGLVEEHWDLPAFDIRVGINTGLVVLGGGVEADKSAMGMAINLAARMESASPAGCLLISHDTYRHVQGLFEVEPQPLLQVKGSQEPLLTYIVRRAKPRSFQDARRGISGYMAPLFGRQAEMGRLTSAYQALLSGAGIQHIGIIGEPGVGKSRLLYEFERWCQSQPVEPGLLRGRAAQLLSRTPYALLREVIMDGLDLQGADQQQNPSSRLLSGLSDYLNGDVEMKAHFIGALIGLEFPASYHLRGVQNDPDQLTQRAFAYLLEYFTALLDMRPVVVFLDDLQWADSPSLDAFLYIAGECLTSRLMLVISARPEFDELHPAWDREIERLGPARHGIRLRRLTPEDCRAMVAEILKSTHRELDELREKVVARADGNPFYIEELIKMLVEGSVVSIGPDGSWQISSDALDDLHIPATLTAVLQARLDSLPQSQKRTLQSAAVVGRVFWDAALGCLQEDAPQALGSDLQGLSGREFILPGGDSPFVGTAEYQFKHQLLHDVAYDTVLKSQRRRCHALLAAWLADRADANQVTGQFAAVIAQHYQGAGDPLRAAHWYCAAGEYAMSRGAPEQAMGLFQTATRLLPPDEHELRWLSLVGQVQAVSRLGRARAGLELSEELYTVARRLDDGYKTAAALQNKAYFLGVSGDYHREMETIQQALQAARQSGNREVEGTVIGLMVVSLSNSGNLQEADKAAELALAFAQTLEEGELLAKLLINLSVFYTTSGDLAQAARLTIRQVEIARRLGDLRSEAYNLENLGYQYVQLGRYEQGLGTLEQVIALAVTLGDRRLATYNQLNLGLVYLRGDELEQAKVVLEAAIASVEGQEEIFTHGTGLTYLGLVQEKCSEISEAAASFEAAVELLQEAEARGYLCDARAGLARCNAVRGAWAAAIEAAERVWEFLQENGSSALEFPILAYLTCAEIFAAHDQELSGRVLEAGFQDLTRRAGQISDLDWRQVYLHHIPEHKKILEWRSSR